MTARGRRLAVGLGVALVLGAVGLANAHLVYVALDSQPDCAPHVRPGESAGAYGAAQPSC